MAAINVDQWLLMRHAIEHLRWVGVLLCGRECGSTRGALRWICGHLGWIWGVSARDRDWCNPDSTIVISEKE